MLLLVPVGVVCLIHDGPASADKWDIEPGIGVRETYTTNVDLLPSDQARGDFITELTPRIAIRGHGARFNFNGILSATGLLYAHESENDRVVPDVHVSGTVEAVEKFFYVDSMVSASQSYLTPFGAQQPSNINVNRNRYTYSQYEVSPYLKGAFSPDTTYLLRSDNTWTNTGQTSFALNSSYDSHWIARVDHAPTPLGWSAEFNRDSLKYPDQQALIQQQARGTMRDLIRAEIEVSAVAGYEWNRLTLTESNNPIYGAGFRWRPNERTTFTGNWEHRFFGGSYFLQFDHRTPLSAWTFTASRNTTNYPQNFLSLPAGGNVAALVDAAFTTRIPDPAQRQQAVEQFLRQTGLPPQLASPINFYTQQITLTQLVSGTFALIGVRNVLAFTVFQQKNNLVAGAIASPLPPELGLGQNNTQRGVSASFTHQLTGLTSLNVSATRLKTVDNGDNPAQSTQDFLALLISTRLSPKTSAYAGGRYNIFNSNLFENGYREAAAYVGIDYRF